MSAKALVDLEAGELHQYYLDLVDALKQLIQCLEDISTLLTEGVTDSEVVESVSKIVGSAKEELARLATHHYPRHWMLPESKTLREIVRRFFSTDCELGLFYNELLLRDLDQITPQFVGWLPRYRSHTLSSLLPHFINLHRLSLVWAGIYFHRSCARAAFLSFELRMCGGQYYFSPPVWLLNSNVVQDTKLSRHLMAVAELTLLPLPDLEIMAKRKRLTNVFVSAFSDIVTHFDEIETVSGASTEPNSPDPLPSPRNKPALFTSSPHLPRAPRFAPPVMPNDLAKRADVDHSFNSKYENFRLTLSDSRLSPEIF